MSQLLLSESISLTKTVVRELFIQIFAPALVCFPTCLHQQSSSVELQETFPELKLDCYYSRKRDNVVCILSVKLSPRFIKYLSWAQKDY